MKRSKPLTRRTPLRKGKPLSRVKCRLKKSKLSAVSRKQRQKNQRYSEVRVKFLAENPWCKVCEDNKQMLLATEIIVNPSVIRVNPATQVHHRGRKWGKWLCDVRYFLPVCDTCHRHVENHGDWARARGYLLTPDQVRKINEERSCLS